MQADNKLLLTVFITILIDMLGIGVLIPVFPLLVTHGSEFCITPVNWTQGQSYIMSGWLLATYPLVQFIFSPILGQLSDRIGRRKILLFSIFGTALSYILFGLSIFNASLVGLFISRILDGISGANIATAQAVISDISEAKHRARNFGLIGVSIGVGFVLGPCIGGVLSSHTVFHGFDAATPFWFSASLSLLNCYLVYRYLPETNKHIANNRNIELLRALKNIASISKLGQLTSIIPVMFLYNFGWTFFTSFWGIVLVKKYAYSQINIGYFFGYLGIMIILAQGGVVRRLSGKHDEVKVLKIALLISGLSLLLYYFVPHGHANYIYLITPFLALGAALSKSFSSALITRLAHEKKQGEAMGINSSANALAQSIPALIAGYIAYLNPEFSILVGALVVIASWLWFNISSRSLS